MFNNLSSIFRATRMTFLEIYDLRVCRHFRLAMPLSVTILNENSSSYTVYPQQQVFWHTEHCDINQIVGCQLTNQAKNNRVSELQAWIAWLVCIMDPTGMTWHGPVRYYQWYQHPVKRCAICIAHVWKSVFLKVNLQPFEVINPSPMV